MKKDTLITGLALFAMFFGAGNLIFPPFLGMESGTDWVIGFLCFILIDVALSCLGIFALTAAGGANAAVEGSLGRVPGLVLNTAVILCTAWLVTSPYTLSWYDLIAWAPLALLRPTRLDGLMVLRGAALSVAYVTGRTVGFSDLMVDGVAFVVRDVICSAIQWYVC